jgi:hypothetical protein
MNNIQQVLQEVEFKHLLLNPLSTNYLTSLLENTFYTNKLTRQRVSLKDYLYSKFQSVALSSKLHKTSCENQSL